MANESKSVLQEVFGDFHHLPFLFVGSGMSRRYLGLPDWEGLLRRFAEIVTPGNPLALEVFKHDGVASWPEVATRLETAFNQMWLTDKRYEKARDALQEQVKGGASPFKLEVAQFVASASRTTEKQLLDELSVLKNVAKRSVAGVITTNYDLLPEDIFSGYGVFIGQEELLFSETHGVAEIYKIHGCCTRPESIVINAADYAAFNKRNAYLAAKLLTVFVEHPIVFLGYSISDQNVQGILSAIVDCLSHENLGRLKERLVFVEYSPDPLPVPVVRDHTINFDGADQSLEMTRIQLHDFMPLYTELLSRKYEYNPKLLRQLKRDIYRLITTNEPVDRFKVVDIDDDELESVEVLAGVGVGEAEATNHESGHHIPRAEALFRDIVFDDGHFDLQSLVENALALLLNHHSQSLPVHKYIAAYEDEYGAEVPEGVRHGAKQNLDGFLNNGLRAKRKQNTYDSLAAIKTEAEDDARIIEMIPLLSADGLIADEIGEFIRGYLEANPTALGDAPQTLKTNLKRVIKIYDWLKYGKEKGVPTT